MIKTVNVTGFRMRQKHFGKEAKMKSLIGLMVIMATLLMGVSMVEADVGVVQSWFFPNVPYKTTSLSGVTRIEHYNVFVFKFHNKGGKIWRIIDSYTLVADLPNGRKAQMEPESAILLKAELEKKWNIKDASVMWVGDVYPGVVKYRIVLFNNLSNDVQTFKLFVKGVHSRGRIGEHHYVMQSGKWRVGKKGYSPGIRTSLNPNTVQTVQEEGRWEER